MPPLGSCNVKMIFLKKIDMMPISERYALVDKSNTDLSISKQCELLCINRSSLYDVKQPKIESEMNLEILELMDKKYTERSDYGSG